MGTSNCPQQEYVTPGSLSTAPRMACSTLPGPRLIALSVEPTDVRHKVDERCAPGADGDLTSLPAPAPSRLAARTSPAPRPGPNHASPARTRRERSRTTPPRAAARARCSVVSGHPIYIPGPFRATLMPFLLLIKLHQQQLGTFTGFALRASTTWPSKITSFIKSPFCESLGSRPTPVPLRLGCTRPMTPAAIESVIVVRPGPRDRRRSWRSRASLISTPRSAKSAYRNTEGRRVSGSEHQRHDPRLPPRPPPGHESTEIDDDSPNRYHAVAFHQMIGMNSASNSPHVGVVELRRQVRLGRASSS